MLRFFRKIRQSLITDNKVSKYLLYAVGEILLVVVGILIALQINNWNEDKKRRTVEIKIYREIYHDLSETLLDIEDDLEDHYRNQTSNEYVRKVMLEKMTYRDTLRYHLAISIDPERLTLSSTGYEALKSIGFDILTNDSIRHSITNLYQAVLPSLIDRNKDFGLLWEINERSKPLLQKHLKVNPAVIDQPRRGDRYLIRDYDAFLNDDLLLVAFQSLHATRRVLIYEYEYTVGAIEGLMHAIEEELHSLEKNGGDF